MSLHHARQLMNNGQSEPQAGATTLALTVAKKGSEDLLEAAVINAPAIILYLEAQLSVVLMGSKINAGGVAMFQGIRYQVLEHAVQQLRVCKHPTAGGGFMDD
jgi:hypothetical protein